MQNTNGDGASANEVEHALGPTRMNIHEGVKCNTSCFQYIIRIYSDQPAVVPLASMCACSSSPILNFRFGVFLCMVVVPVPDEREIDLFKRVSESNLEVPNL
jgi:hypothetical protein